MINKQIARSRACIRSKCQLCTHSFLVLLRLGHYASGNAAQDKAEWRPDCQRSIPSLFYTLFSCLRKKNRGLRCLFAVGRGNIIGNLRVRLQLLVELPLVRQVKSLPLQPSRQTAPNIWQKQHDGLNASRHHLALVDGLSTAVVQLHESVPRRNNRSGQREAYRTDLLNRSISTLSKHTTYFCARPQQLGWKNS